MDLRSRLGWLIVPLLIVISTSRASAAPPAKSKTPAKAAVTKSKPPSKAKKKIDYNALGLASFQKKNYPEALKQFELATVNDPKNPFAWMNRARAVIAINIQTEPIDYCDYPKNWILDALASLSMAIEVNRKKSIPQLQTFKEPSFAKFRTRPEFKNWFVLTRLPLKTDLATQEFFAKNNDWLIKKQPMPSTVVTFAPNHALTIASAEGGREVGTWTAGADRVVIKTTAAPRTMNLTVGNFNYDPKKTIKLVVVKDQDNGEEWVMGPEIADCPQ